MPTNTPRLKAALKAAMQANIPNPTPEQTAAFDTTANAMAEAIIFEIKQLNINYSGGLANSGGPVTGTMLYSIT